MLNLFRNSVIKGRFQPFIPPHIEEQRSKSEIHQKIKTQIGYYKDLMCMLREWRAGFVKLSDHPYILPKLIEACDTDESGQELETINTMLINQEITLKEYGDMCSDITAQRELSEMCRAKCVDMLEKYNTRQTQLIPRPQIGYIFAAFATAFFLCIGWVKRIF